MRPGSPAVLVAMNVVLALLHATSGSAQILAAQVVDADGRSPVTGADLEVRDTQGVTVARATSDSTGFVRTDLPSDGPFVVRVTRIGYMPYESEPIPARAGESIELEIRLGRDAVPLEPLVVVARTRRSARLAGHRERLARGGFGSFVTRADIERRPVASVSDLIRPLPGVEIVQVARFGNPNLPASLIAMRGTRSGEIAGTGDATWCLPGVFLDGVAIRQTPEFTVDDMLNAANLEGIEVYSTAASVPTEFQRGGSVACGAVLLWTREAEPGGGRSDWWRWALGVAAFAGVLFSFTR